MIVSPCLCTIKNGLPLNSVIVAFWTKRLWTVNLNTGVYGVDIDPAAKLGPCCSNSKTLLQKHLWEKCMRCYKLSWVLWKNSQKAQKKRLFNITIYCLNILYFITVGTNLRVKECGLYFLLLFLPVCFLGHFFAFSVLLFSISKIKVIVKLS